jgi:triosephosphate isomerase
MIAAKAKAVMAVGLIPIVCVGETLLLYLTINRTAL